MGLRRGDRLLESRRERCFREPITYALKILPDCNYSRAAVWQRGVSSSERGRERERGRGVRWWIYTRLNGMGRDNSLPDK